MTSGIGIEWLTRVLQCAGQLAEDERHAAALDSLADRVVAGRQRQQQCGVQDERRDAAVRPRAPGPGRWALGAVLPSCPVELRAQRRARREGGLLGDPSESPARARGALLGEEEQAVPGLRVRDGPRVHIAGVKGVHSWRALCCGLSRHLSVSCRPSQVRGMPHQTPRNKIVAQWDKPKRPAPINRLRTGPVPRAVCSRPSSTSTRGQAGGLCGG